MAAQYRYQVPLINLSYFTPSAPGLNLAYSASLVDVTSGDSGFLVDENYITDEDTQTAIWVTFNYSMSQPSTALTAGIYLYRSDGQVLGASVSYRTGHWIETTKYPYGHIATGGVVRVTARYINNIPATSGSFTLKQITAKLVR